eukprot:4485021-Pyramimonas_sp.AAC.1
MVVGLAHKPAFAGRWTTSFAPQFVPLLDLLRHSPQPVALFIICRTLSPEVDLRALHEEAVHLGLRQ